MATPGSGTFPLFTTPCSRPPAVVCATCAGVVSAAEAAEGACGFAGACPHAARLAAIAVAATVQRVAGRRMNSPWEHRSAHSDEQQNRKVYAIGCVKPS